MMGLNFTFLKFSFLLENESRDNNVYVTDMKIPLSTIIFSEEVLWSYIGKMF